MVFADALRGHAERHPITSIQKNEWGTKYVIECSIVAPKGDSHCIRVVWIHQIDGEIPRLVTAHALP